MVALTAVLAKVHESVLRENMLRCAPEEIVEIPMYGEFPTKVKQNCTAMGKCRFTKPLPRR